MAKRMFTILEVYIAAYHWYGKSDLDSCCLAEDRLMKGELPYAGF